ELKEYNGLPSKNSVDAVFSYLENKNRKELFEQIPQIIKNRNTPVEKQIYSTYKAASYFINLAKDKFHLINEKNKLTEKGKLLLSLRANFFKLSSKEQKFFFQRIIEVDFHFFISTALFIKIQKKYKLKEFKNEIFNFLDLHFGIRHFNFTSSSLDNYNKVRMFWMDEIGLLDTNFNIKKIFLKEIQQMGFEEDYMKLLNSFNTYEKQNFRSKKNYLQNRNKFLDVYKTSILKANDLGFVNLYDLKDGMRISYEGFQKFLNEFYENEKSNYNIFFNNIVSSIDRRKRFYVRNKPIINIKIKK
ncbi:hypothetical protein, partial [Chryseobacterium candidae]|uniref:hypothetical protein n=1 Tax=Chryseobacterium candidae TaxID=1978493 RepID=UPI001456D26E